MTLRARPPRQSDIESVLAICRSMDIALIGESEFTLRDFHEEWEELDLERNAWLVEADGQPAGWMQVDDRGSGRIVADGYVHPAHAGKGVGSLLVDLAETRAEEMAQSQPVGASVQLENAVLAADPGAGRLLADRGYRPIRHFLRMVLDMRERPGVGDVPEGIRIEPFHGDEAEQVHAAIMEAMADHWQFSPQTLDRWLQRTRRELFDPKLWLIAWEGGEVAGALLGSWKQWDVGWIDTVAVRRPWRGRGIAGALLERSFREFYDRGERRCALGVDADSPTGATRVYERVGMRALWQADVYAKRLR